MEGRVATLKLAELLTLPAVTYMLADPRVPSMNVDNSGDCLISLVHAQNSTIAHLVSIIEYQQNQLIHVSPPDDSDAQLRDRILRAQVDKLPRSLPELQSSFPAAVGKISKRAQTSINGDLMAGIVEDTKKVAMEFAEVQRKEVAASFTNFKDLAANFVLQSELAQQFKKFHGLNLKSNSDFDLEASVKALVQQQLKEFDRKHMKSNPDSDMESSVKALVQQQLKEVAGKNMMSVTSIDMEYLAQQRKECATPMAQRVK